MKFPPRSMFGIETEAAQIRLNRILKKYDWFSSVGIRGGKEPSLVIQVTSDDHPEIDGKSRFRGFNVEVFNFARAGEEWQRQILENQINGLP